MFSVPSAEVGERLVRELSTLLRNRGFNLTKWISNDPLVLKSIPENKRAASIVELQGSGDCYERVLGVQWSLEDDCFKFQVGLLNKPVTRKGMLSALSSLFDPLGFFAPVILTARLILQELCRRKYGWDENIPEEDARKWKCWIDDLCNLPRVTVPRCFVRPGFNFADLTRRELHHFADASSVGYSTVSYLRILGRNDSVICSFVLGKSRLAPLKKVSIPRLELTAATMAARVDSMLRAELGKMVTDSIFWTDSLVVLFMIRNSTKRFPVFVANRLSQIEEISEPTQWRFIEGASNPADVGTRPATTGKLLEYWLSGPSFLQEPESIWPAPPCDFPDLPEEFKALKCTVATSKVTKVDSSNSMERRFARFSLFRLKKAVAWLLRLRDKWLKREIRKGPLTVDEIIQAETSIIKTIQREAYPNEYQSLNSRKNLDNKICNSLRKLNPILVSGILRVGGRLRRSACDFDVKHPVIMPPNSHVTQLLIEEYHRKIGHSGTFHTWTTLRQRYWVVKGVAAICKVLGHCLFCKRRNSSFGTQFMADLPFCRVTSGNPAFHFTGIDFFGPIMVKQGRSLVKHYGCVFTCLTMRAVHLELSYSLDTDAFINALRRFISRRGKPHTFFSDNGSNFVGGNQELRRSIQNLNQETIEERLKQDEIRWKFNPPYANHMGGIWERVKVRLPEPLELSRAELKLVCFYINLVQFCSTHFN